MKTIELLELLANNPYHNQVIQDLIDTQAQSIRKAIINKDISLLRENLSKDIYLANMSRVAQF